MYSLNFISNILQLLGKLDQQSAKIYDWIYRILETGAFYIRAKQQSYDHISIFQLFVGMSGDKFCDPESQSIVPPAVVQDFFAATSD